MPEQRVDTIKAVAMLLSNLGAYASRGVEVFMGRRWEAVPLG
jgi:hypothetical protein